MPFILFGICVSLIILIVYIKHEIWFFAIIYYFIIVFSISVIPYTVPVDQLNGKSIGDGTFYFKHTVTIFRTQEPNRTCDEIQYGDSTEGHSVYYSCESKDHHNVPKYPIQKLTDIDDVYWTWHKSRIWGYKNTKPF